MATLLYRLGRWACRRRFVVVAVWVAVLGGVGLAAAVGSGLAPDSRSMPGTESQAAFDLLRQRFPGGADGASARVVFVAPAGGKIAGYRAVVDGLVNEVAGAVRPVLVSSDGSTAYTTVTYPVAEPSQASRDELRVAVDRARAAGLTVEVGGPVLAGKPRVGGVSEVVGVGLAALVLLIAFGSVAAAGLPLVTALLGVGVSTLAIVAVGAAFGLSSTSGILASMLGLAVGIDYALFVVSRYREERAGGQPAPEAVGLAVGTAGSAVVFAGLTVVITLAGLSVVGIPVAARMGLAAAGAVVVAVLVALTLVPALLGFWPEAVLARRVRPRAENRGTRWARVVTRRPVPVLLGAVAVLVVLALPVPHLELGTPGDEGKSTATTERRAYDALARGFGPGANGPLTVVVDGRSVREVVARIAGTEGVASVSPARFNSAGDTAVFTAIPDSAPTDERTKELVRRIRAERAGAPFLVTGETAVNIDLADKVPGALGPYLALVLGLAFLLLLMIFRSPIVPLEAVFGFLLSTLAALGAVVAVFQWGWGAGLIGLRQTGPVISTMPIMLVGMIFGLAMDYEVFFVSRMREAHTRGEPARQAVITGFRHSARIVVAAALIMIAVFSGFVGADLPMIKMIGFSLAAAVLLDAFVVRMALVPALLAVTGELAWRLPRWLDRWLPHVDVEGAALRRGADRPPYRTLVADQRSRAERSARERSEPMLRTIDWRQYAREHPRVADAVLIALLLCAAAGQAELNSSVRGVDGLGWHSAVPLAVAASVVLVWRRGHPRTVLACTALCVCAEGAIGYLITPVNLAPVMVSLYELAVRAPGRPTRWGYLAVTAPIVAAALVGHRPGYPWPLEILNPVAFLLLPVALAETARLRHAHAERDARHRVAEERLRIARELHDIVAHHLALANAQAGTAAYLAATRPEQAHRMLTELTGTTSSALRELKATVGLLRDDLAAPLEPAPGLGRLAELTAAFGSAGLDVRVTVEGEARPLAPSVDLTAFRIVQEALTNVTKHAATGTARVRLTYGAALTITITNDGEFGSAGEPGFGIAGMRERAQSAGGRFHAGPGPRGGFAVTTELPILVRP